MGSRGVFTAETNMYRHVRAIDLHLHCLAQQENCAQCRRLMVRFPEVRAAYEKVRENGVFGRHSPVSKDVFSEYVRCPHTCGCVSMLKGRRSLCNHRKKVTSKLHGNCHPGCAGFKFVEADLVESTKRAAAKKRKRKKGEENAEIDGETGESLPEWSACFPSLERWCENHGNTVRRLVLAKDMLKISWRKWSTATKLFKVTEKKSTVHHIRNAIQGLSMESFETEQGFRKSFPEFLQSRLELVFRFFAQNSPSEKMEDIFQEGQMSVVVKVGLDGASLTNKRGVNECIATISFVNLAVGGCLEQIMSPSFAHTFYCGWNVEEKNAVLREELRDVNFEDGMSTPRNVVLFSETGQKTIKVKLIPFVCVDMKALCAILGIKNVYIKSSHERCPFCLIRKNDMGNLGTTYDERQLNGASVFDEEVFPKEAYLMDMLHCLLNITRKLVRNILASLDAKDEHAVSAFWDFFDSCSVDLRKDGNMSLLESFDQSRSNRNHMIELLQKYEEICTLSEEYCEVEDDTKPRRIFEGFINCFVRLCDVMDESKADELKHDLVKWGELYKEVYTASEITTYIHVFVHHTVPMALRLAEYNTSLGDMSAYDVEGKHFVLKTSNHGNVGSKTVCKTLLENDERSGLFDFASDLILRGAGVEPFKYLCNHIKPLSFVNDAKRGVVKKEPALKKLRENIATQ